MRFSSDEWTSFPECWIAAGDGSPCCALQPQWAQPFLLRVALQLGEQSRTKTPVTSCSPKCYRPSDCGTRRSPERQLCYSSGQDSVPSMRLEGAGIGFVFLKFFIIINIFNFYFYFLRTEGVVFSEGIKIKILQWLARCIAVRPAPVKSVWGNTPSFLDVWSLSGNRDWLHNNATLPSKF